MIHEIALYAIAALLVLITIVNFMDDPPEDEVVSTCKEAKGNDSNRKRHHDHDREDRTGEREDRG